MTGFVDDLFRSFSILNFISSWVLHELGLVHYHISTTFQPPPHVRNNTMLGFMDAVITLHQNVNLPRRHGNIQRCVEAICERLSQELLQMSDIHKGRLNQNVNQSEGSVLPVFLSKLLVKWEDGTVQAD